MNRGNLYLSLLVLLLSGCAGGKSIQKIELLPTIDTTPVYLDNEYIFTSVSSAFYSPERALELAYSDILRQVLLHAGLVSAYHYNINIEESGIGFSINTKSQINQSMSNRFKFNKIIQNNLIEIRDGLYKVILKVSITKKTIDEMIKWSSYLREIEVEKIKKPFKIVKCRGDYKKEKNDSRFRAENNALKLAKLSCLKNYSEQVNSIVHTRSLSMDRNSNNEVVVISNSIIGDHEVLNERLEWQGNTVNAWLELKFYK
jgi:hypothetical protein